MGSPLPRRLFLVEAIFVGEVRRLEAQGQQFHDGVHTESRSRVQRYVILKSASDHLERFINRNIHEQTLDIEADHGSIIHGLHSLQHLHKVRSVRTYKSIGQGHM